MAITKILTIGSCGDRFHGRHLKQAIDYITAPEKTQDCRYVGSINCQPNKAFAQMKATKRKFGKMDKRQGYHIVISFEEEDVEPGIAYEIVQRFVDEYLQERYETIYSVHDDTLHRHCHIIFNSVDCIDGRKFRYEKGDWERVIQPITNRLCEEYGLSTIEVSFDGIEKGRRCSNYKEYQEYRLTWKDYIKRDLDACIMQADSFEEFLTMLQDKGYQIKQNKYLAVKPEGMQRFSRCKTFGEEYTEERIKERIATESIQTYAKRSFVEEPKDEFLRRTKLTGIQKTYYAKVCRLRKIEKLPYSKAWQYRDEIRKLNACHEQYLFLVKHDIHSVVELAAVKNNLELKVEECHKERNQYHRKKRRMKPLFDIAEKMETLQPAVNSFLAGDEYFDREHTQYEELAKQLENEGYTLTEVQSLRTELQNQLAGNYEKQNAAKDNLKLATKMMQEIEQQVAEREMARKQNLPEEKQRTKEQDKQPKR